jgi:hypothetical protein
MAATWTKTGARSVAGVQAATEAVPLDSAPTDGIRLESTGGFDLIVDLEDGQTFTGNTWTLDAYRYYPAAGGWAWAPDIAQAPEASVIGKRRYAWTGFTVANPHGNLAHICNGVQHTGGVITVRYAASGLRGEEA